VAWRVVLVVGRLLLLVARPPSGDWEHCLHEELHVPIWPVGRTWAQYSDEITVPDELPAQTLWTIMGLRIIAAQDRDSFGTVSLPI
jgi:hypothetical protein